MNKKAVYIAIALAAVVFFLGWLQKAPCRDGRWTDFSQFKQACYTDVVALYYSEGLRDGAVPYRDHALEYPVLMGAFMGAIGLPIHDMVNDQGSANQVTFFYNITAFLLGLCALLTVWLVARMRPDRQDRWLPLWLALSPALIFLGTVNWDLLAVVLLIAALYSWQKDRPILSGIYIGLGTATKFFPGFVLFPLLILAIKNGSYKPFFKTAGAAFATWLVVNLPVAVLYPNSWLEFFRLNSTRGIDWGTSWFILHALVGFDPMIKVLNLLYFILFAGICGVIMYMVLQRRRVQDSDGLLLWQLTFVVTAAFLLVGKVWSPQYILWLLPLAVLSKPRDPFKAKKYFWAFMAWQIAEVCYFFSFMNQMMVALGAHSVSTGLYTLATIGRWGCVFILAFMIVQSWQSENTRIS